MRALVPIALTIPALMIGLTAPFAGLIVDAIDRKRLLIAAMVAYSVFGTAPLYLDTLGAIVASRVGVGLCEAAILVCCTTLIVQLSYVLTGLGFADPGVIGAAAAGMSLATAAGAIVFARAAGRGPRVLLPVEFALMNRLAFAQRGRGTGIWTGTLFVGQFLCPLLILAVAAAVGGLQPALGVLAVAAVVMAVGTALSLRGTHEPLDAAAHQA